MGTKCVIFFVLKSLASPPRNSLCTRGRGKTNHRCHRRIRFPPSLLAIELPRFSTMGSQNEYRMAKISMLFSSCPKRLTLRHRHQVVSIMRILFIKRASRTKLCLISSSAPHRPFKDLNRVPPLTRDLHQDSHRFSLTIEHHGACGLSSPRPSNCHNNAENTAPFIVHPMPDTQCHKKGQEWMDKLQRAVGK